jgi:predicted aldo/keto reductase-like oxidoreductase
MQYRKLGDSGMYVSAIAYGNWTTPGAQIGQDAATSCVFTALDLGITTFDCVRWPSFPRCAALPTWGRRGRSIVDPPG